MILVKKGKDIGKAINYASCHEVPKFVRKWGVEGVVVSCHHLPRAAKKWQIGGRGGEGLAWEAKKCQKLHKWGGWWGRKELPYNEGEGLAEAAVSCQKWQKRGVVDQLPSTSSIHTSVQSSGDYASTAFVKEADLLSGSKRIFVISKPFYTLMLL